MAWELGGMLASHPLAAGQLLQSARALVGSFGRALAPLTCNEMVAQWRGR